VGQRGVEAKVVHAFPLQILLHPPANILNDFLWVRTDQTEERWEVPLGNIIHQPLELLNGPSFACVQSELDPLELAPQPVIESIQQLSVRCETDHIPNPDIIHDIEQVQDPWVKETFASDEAELVRVRELRDGTEIVRELIHGDLVLRLDEREVVARHAPIRTLIDYGVL
jgi:hypothetical protein